MTNQHSARDRAIVEFPRDAVCLNVFPPLEHASITVCPSAPLPLPTFVRVARGNTAPKTICQSSETNVVSQKRNWLTFDKSAPYISLRRYFCLLTTTTLAKTARIGFVCIRMSLIVMAADKASGLPFDVPAFLVSCLCNRRGLPTTAVAVTKRDFLSGLLRGILSVHQKFTFLVSCHGTIPVVAVALLIGLLPVHYTT